jgi:hypothetical protein
MRLLHSQKNRAEITAKMAKMTPAQMLPVWCACACVASNEKCEKSERKNEHVRRRSRTIDEGEDGDGGGEEYREADREVDQLSGKVLEHHQPQAGRKRSDGRADGSCEENVESGRLVEVLYKP